MRSVNRISQCLFFIVGLVACRERAADLPQPLPDPGITWQLHDDFLFDEKNQLSSYADSSRIILAGTRATSIAPGDNRPATDTNFVHYGGGAHPNGRTDYRPLLTPTFIAFLYTSHVNILPTASPVLSGGNVPVYMTELDKDFAQFAVLPIGDGETMVANQRNQLVIPYSRYLRSYNTPVIDGNRFYIALVDVDYYSPNSVSLDVKKSRIVEVPTGGFPASINSIGDYFIVSSRNGSTYRIAPDGSLTQTYPYPMFRQFTYKGTVYGMTYDAGNTLKLVASTDQGATWSVVLSQLPSDFYRLTYKVINNVLIGTYYSQLFRIDLTANSLTSTELDNTNLRGNYITSVAAFRNTVYVSTLSGVFTKPIRTFLTPLKK
jgi:hypothetical protein